jgi:hypothetical protein
MKILCLLTLLANIFLLSWEYRNGTFSTHKESPEQQAVKGKEPILLLQELKKETHSVLPNKNQVKRVDLYKPDNNQIREIQDNIEHTNTATAKQDEYPPIQLP